MCLYLNAKKCLLFPDISLFFSGNLLDQGKIYMFSYCLHNTLTSSFAAILSTYHGWKKNSFSFVQNTLMAQEDLDITKASLSSFVGFQIDYMLNMLNKLIKMMVGVLNSSCFTQMFRERIICPIFENVLPQ